MVTQLSEPVPWDVSFVPVLTIRRDIDKLAREFGFSVQEGQDDLDKYKVVHLVTDAGCKFLLVQYRGSGSGIVDIFLPPKLADYRQCLGDILHELGVDKADAIDREVA